MSGDDPLEDLYTNEDEFDRQALKEALDGIIKIDEDDGSPIRRPGFEELNAEQSFAAYLLYRRAAVELGDIPEDELGATSAEVVDEIDVSDSTLRNHTDEDWLQNDESMGGYYIPGYDVDWAIELIENSED